MIKQAIVREYRLYITAAILHDISIRESHVNNNSAQICNGERGGRQIIHLEDG